MAVSQGRPLIRKFAEVDNTETNLSRRCHLHAIVLSPALRHTFHRKRDIRFHRKKFEKRFEKIAYEKEILSSNLRLCISRAIDVMDAQVPLEDCNSFPAWPPWVYAVG